MKNSLIITLIFSAIAIQAQNFNFENWSTTTKNQDSLIGWSSTNNAVYNVSTMVTSLTQSTDTNSGSYSAQIQTAPFGFSGAPIVGIMVNGEAKLGFDAANTSYGGGGGDAYTLRPTDFNGYYKLIGSYNGLVKVILSKHNASSQKRDTIAHGSLSLASSTASFTQFSIPLNYLSANNPDTATIIIYASDPSVVPSLNASFSSLYLDDFSYNFPPAIADGGVSEIVSPVASSPINDSVPVYGWVKNYGAVDLFNFDVAYTVDGNNKVVKAFTDTLFVGDSVLFSFMNLKWTPTSAGNYNICMFLENVSNDINHLNDTSCVSVSSTLSNKENILLEFTTYPNPTRSTVHFKNLINRNYKVSIQNLNGQTVHTEVLQNNEINIESLHSGVYILCILNREGVLIGRQKIVKE